MTECSTRRVQNKSATIWRRHHRQAVPGLEDRSQSWNDSTVNRDAMNSPGKRTRLCLTVNYKVG